MKQTLDRLYAQYNRREYVHPDPLECLYDYEDVRDREIAGLIASSLAYGKVAQIIKSVSGVLDIMGKSPFAYLYETSENKIQIDFDFFVHRFAKGTHLSALLIRVKHFISAYGSIYQGFIEGFHPSDESLVPALVNFSKKITETGGDGDFQDHPGHLMPCPDKGSACKRLNLYLRWMVRCDAVDPGGWPGISASKLIIPLDTHMFRISRGLGLTQRKQANLKAAIEITQGFKQWSPDDPVQYDFALTRFGIQNGGVGHAALMKELGIENA